MVHLTDICWIFMMVRLSTASMRLVDLAHQTDTKMMTWPTNPAYNFSILFRGYYKAGVWLENNYFEQPEHAGTHVDAPSHLGNKGGLKMHQLRMKDLYGPGVIINVKDKAAANPDYGVTIEDVKEYEEKYGRIPYDAVVIMNSGWFYRYPDRQKVFNSDMLNDSTTYHFPAWLGNTTQWLINNRDIKILGVDTPSIDIGQDTSFISHIILSTGNVVGLENVAYIDKIPESGTTIYVPALKIYNGSGAPARVFATFDDGVDDDPEGLNNAVQCKSLSYIYSTILLCVASALLYH